MDLVAVYAVFALFVFMLSLLRFCVLPFSSVNKDLYNFRHTFVAFDQLIFEVADVKPTGRQSWQNSVRSQSVNALRGPAAEPTSLCIINRRYYFRDFVPASYADYYYRCCCGPVSAVSRYSRALANSPPPVSFSAPAPQRHGRLAELYKSLFTENSVATQKHSSASINTDMIE